jgi:hypothetical protein
MIFCRQIIPGAFFASQTSQICRVAVAGLMKIVAKVAKIAPSSRFSGVTVLFFPWHDHC